MPGLHVCLIGSEQQENLGLEYLAAAVEQAGHRVTVLPFESRQDIAAVVAAVAEAAPELVGLSLAFQHGISDNLRLIEALREQGYQGHLTCGGQVPTFCHAELLRDAPGLDTVVRFEGERTLVELLDVLAAGRPPQGIAGLVWRERDAVVAGPPRPLCADLDALPFPKRRPSAFHVGGLPLAFVITARGCPGDCTYCCLTAFAGAAGGARFRMRDPQQVADEIALLRRERGVRVVVLQDDLFILRSQRASIERMTRIRCALQERSVDDVLFWIKGRPETITAPVLEAARAMGAIHLFLGVESASSERLQYLGRTHQPEDNRRAVALCKEHGLMPSFNLMLFDPDSTMDDIAQSLDFASHHLDLPWNICRTEIYSGTKLLERLAAEGRLQGHYQSYGYRMKDPAAEVMFRILRVCLHDRAFACDSLINRLISLSFAKQIHQELFPGRAADSLVREVEGLVVEVYTHTVELLRRIFEYCSAANIRDDDAVRSCAIGAAQEVHARDLGWSTQVTTLWDRLHARGMVLARAGEPSLSWAAGASTGQG